MTLYTGGFNRFVAFTAATIVTAGTKVAGRDLHLPKDRAFARRTK
jgi:hypothetical protein